MALPMTQVSRPTDAAFETELKNVARSLRSSLSALMAAAGMDPQDPKALTNRWGVNKTLSWRISKVVQTDDAYLALQQLPGKEAVGSLLELGKAAGVAEQYVQATNEAVRQFDELIEQHCGDRATFEMMGSDVSPAARSQQAEINRKQLFYGASGVWGVQAKLFLTLRVVGPGSSPGTSDLASISGMFGFRRLRENTPWVMARRRFHNDGKPFSPPCEPLDPASVGQPMELMPEFCSKPLPVLRELRDGDTSVIELEPGRAGNAGVLSCVGGALHRNLPHVRAGADDRYNASTVSNTPAETLIFDLYIHEGFKEAFPPSPILLSLVGSGLTTPELNERYSLPLHEPLIELGHAQVTPATPEVPRYGEMLKVIFERTGWSPQQFRGYRIKMAYPPVPTALVAVTMKE